MSLYELDHVVNQLLPNHTKQCLDINESQSIKDITESLKTLEDSNEIVCDSKTISRACRLLMSHITLKYRFENSFKGYAAKVLYFVFRTKQCSIPIKSKLLYTITTLIQNKNERVNFELNWKDIWDEALDYILREKKNEHSASDEIIGNYVYRLIEFLMAARKVYIGQSAQSIQVILEFSSRKLSSLQSCVAFEGVLILLACLPTDFSEYDTYLPIWLSAWTSIEHNQAWDMCWLTIFTRARKFTTNFDWSKISGMLLVKARQLLGINVGTGHEQFSQFPKTVPQYYQYFFGRNADIKKTALKKMAKLLYFVTIFSKQGFENAVVRADPITTTPVEIPTAYGSHTAREFPGYNTHGNVLPQAAEICLFFQTMRPFFYPSNTGSWTSGLAQFMTSFFDEISSHIGSSLAFKLFPTQNFNLPVDTLKVFKNGVHVPTIQYLIGSCLSLIIEGLYGKSPAMVQSATTCVKNILALDPSYADVFLPLFMSSLDPSAVTQAHQALAALQALIQCFKHLLYPRPVVLRYLPDLLKLALPGIDASDQTKTAITLKFFSTVFNWIPIRSKYEYLNVDSTAYIDLVDTSSGLHQVDYSSTQREDLESLASSWQEWIPLFWDRIELVLKSMEGRNKGNKSSLNMIAGSIAECISNVYRAVKPNNRNDDIQFNVLFENRIIESAVKTASYSSAKAMAKILRVICTSNPSSLERALGSLIDEEVLSLSCSNEKLAYRLFVIGGACRNGTSAIIPHLEKKLLPIIKNEKFLQHTDKDVRKAFIKLVKNVLRGLTGTYAVNIPSAYEVPIDTKGNYAFILGSPNPICNSVLSWYEPNNEAIISAIDILKHTVSNSLDRIYELVNTTIPSNQATADSSSLALKKIEETLTSYLKLVQKSIRGAAEVLGEDKSKADDRTLEAFADETNQIPYDTEFLTGREVLFKSLPNDADVQYLQCLRREVLVLILNLENSLASSAAEGNSTESNGKVGLFNSSSVSKGWQKLLRILVIHRMSHMRDVDKIKQGMEYLTSIQNSSLSRAVQKHLRYQNPFSSNAGYLLSASEGLSSPLNMNSQVFWWGHDIPNTYIAQNITLHYISHLQAYGSHSLRHYGSPYFLQGRYFRSCMYAVVRSTGHEYDAIRHEAIGTLDKISGRFGGKFLSTLINDVLISIESGRSTSPQGQKVPVDAIINYGTLAGQYSYLRQQKVLSRIASQEDLTLLYLKVIINSPGIIGRVEDPEKRDRLDRHYLDSITKYISAWSYQPSSIQNTSKVEIILSLCLEKLQFKGGSSDGQASSLKHDTVLSFILLHFLGIPTLHQVSSENSILKKVWDWAIETVSTAHGQPVQQIALTALIRLVAVSNRNLNSESVRLIGQKAVEAISWPQFLHGLSICHPKEIDGQNSWTNSLLEAAFNMSCTLPRRDFCDMQEDVRASQPKFQKRFATLIHYIFKLLPSPPDNTIWTVLTAAKELKSTNDVEERANNALLSEVFCGIYQAYFPILTSEKDEISKNNLLWDSIVYKLVDFMSDVTQNLSLNNIYDWTEAIYLMFVRTPVSWDFYSAFNSSSTSGASVLSKHRLAAFILDNFKIAVTDSSGADENSMEVSVQSSSIVEAGFSGKQRALLFLRSMLCADLSACLPTDRKYYIPLENLSKGSVVAQLTFDMLTSSGANVFESPFHNIRVEVGTILGCLSCYLPNNQSLNLSTIVDRLYENKDSLVSSVDIAKYRSEVSKFWIHTLIHYMTIRDGCGVFGLNEAKSIARLLNLVIEGAGHADLEFAKSAHNTVLKASLFLSISYRPNLGATDLLGEILNIFGVNTKHESWHVRETVALALNLCMLSSFTILSNDERKWGKDRIVELQFDVKPEVQSVAVLGMVGYLACKSATDLATIAAAYTKNLETLAAREMKRRKALKDGDPPLALITPQSDRAYWGTIAMAVSLIRAFPYDLPQFIPALLIALIKHSNLVKDRTFISKAVQDFKRSHQDKWSQFSTQFSRDQLDDLQGTGAAHYFA